MLGVSYVHVMTFYVDACALCTFSFIHGLSIPALRLGTLVPRQKVIVHADSRSIRACILAYNKLFLQ